jgi:hypothetical protein
LKSESRKRTQQERAYLDTCLVIPLSDTGPGVLMADDVTPALCAAKYKYQCHEIKNLEWKACQEEYSRLKIVAPTPSKFAACYTNENIIYYYNY